MFYNFLGQNTNTLALPDAESVGTGQTLNVPPASAQKNIQE
jgi:hypothetical protein